MMPSRDLGFINSAFALLAGRWLFRIPSIGIYKGEVVLDMLVLTVLGWTNALQALRFNKDTKEWEVEDQRV